ncbi:MAG: PilZ domain-containing protein [Nitrospinota bacterium]|nr:PilZ domain-containing protein [Nitrospinota bacterium]
MEKRRHPRLRKLLFVAAKRYNQHGELEEGRIGITIDISEGGMMIMTERPLPFMTTVDLFLGFGDTILKVNGEVTRLEKQTKNRTLMGIKFLNVDEEASALLKVASLSASSEGDKEEDASVPETDSRITEEE